MKKQSERMQEELDRIVESVAPRFRERLRDRFQHQVDAAKRYESLNDEEKEEFCKELDGDLDLLFSRRKY